MQRFPFTYSDIIRDSMRLHEVLCANTTNTFAGTNAKDLKEERVAILVENGYNYVRGQWAVWRAGGIFVPLSTTHPPPELEYVLRDSETSIALVDKKTEQILKPIATKMNIRLIQLEPEKTLKRGSSFTMSEVDTLKTYNFDMSRPAMIVYTSGTTGRPKGVVTTHQNIEAQILSMYEPWGWKDEDHILHTLPLNHVHGILNVLLTSLWAGATCEMMPQFDVKKVWERFLTPYDSPSVYMAVPTIYSKLLQEYDSFNPDKKKEVRKCTEKMRLFVSGSSALPESILNRWKEATGHTLLERYGMTEIGMALSNPYKQEERVPGTVGFPLPGVEVKIVDENGPVREGESGELRVKGPTVFKEYWKRPEATKDAFDEEGWFKTGDIAVCKDGRYSILGRNSVDIIKSGGYKISALEVEKVLIEHPSIIDCAVVGLPDEQWGQIVAAVVVQKRVSGAKLTAEITPDSLKTWVKERLAPYKLPRIVQRIDAIPKNAMANCCEELLKVFEKKLGTNITSKKSA